MSHARVPYNELSKFQKFLTFLGLTRFGFPLILLGINFLIPVMDAPLGKPQSDLAWTLIVINIVSLFVWIGAEGWVMVYRYTSSGALIVDTFISAVLAIVLTYFLRENWVWAFFLPWVGTVVDALLGVVLAINNAAQKPLFQDVKRGGD